MKTITKNLFRVLFLTIISISLIVTTSCEDDEDIDNIIGTWELHEVEINENGHTLTFTPEEIGMEMTVVFEEDETYTATIVDIEGTVIENGTWERTNRTTIIITPSDNTSVTLTKDGDYYVVEDNVSKMKFKKQ